MSINRKSKSALSNGTARHALPRCSSTGLARYRDRRQARDGIKSLCSGSKEYSVTSFKCPACRGFHLERIPLEQVADFPKFDQSQPAEGRKRRYMLVDIENMFGGKTRTVEEVRNFWNAITAHAPGIANHDHVVIGASRSVARHYRHLIVGPNIRWVIGANAADGADQALLASINMHQVAKRFDEVVIMSGDHAFTPIAVQARAHGLSVQLVTVESVSPRDNRARSLMHAANTRTVVRLEPRRMQMQRLAQIRQVAVATHADLLAA